MAARYKGGVFTVPGSTGNFAVTGIGFEPQAVLFFGSNKATEDSIVSGGISAVMRGQMAWDDLTSSIVSWCWSIVPHDSMRWEQKPIVCALNGGTGTDYQASAVSFDADGFTLNFTTVPGGTRKVHYVAIGGMSNVFSKTIGSNFGGTSASVALGFRPESAIGVYALDDTVQDACGANRECSIWGHMVSAGGKAFYSTNDLNWVSMFLNAIDTPFNNQDELEIQRYTGSTSYIGFGGHFTGPFLTPHAINATLSGVGQQTINLNVGNDYQGNFIAVPEFSDTGNATPADPVDGTLQVSSGIPEVEVPELLIFYGCLGRESSSNGNPNAVTLGFWTPDHQYGVAANGNDDSFYQSAVNGFIDGLTAGGVHAGEITRDPLPAIGFTLTTKISGVGNERMVWHMFGPPLERAVWIPGHYRRY